MQTHQSIISCARNVTQSRMNFVCIVSEDSGGTSIAVCVCVCEIVVAAFEYIVLRSVELLSCLAQIQMRLPFRAHHRYVVISNTSLKPFIMQTTGR